MMLHRQLRTLDKEDIYFAQFSKNITSQCGEDGIFEVLFPMLPLSEPHPYCVDIGAWDGKHLSNTYTLLHEKGWGGLLVEANEDRCAEARALYATNPKVTCVSSLVSLTGDQSLINTLEQHQVPYDFDFLCIDVDGADYHLWKSIAGASSPNGDGTGEEATTTTTTAAAGSHTHTGFRPKVVCIEFNPSIPHDVFFVQAPDTTIHQGSSLLALQALGRDLGYVLVAVTLFNGIFVRDDLLSYLPPHVRFPQDLDRIHVPNMTTTMFQTYDGELKYIGVKKLLWHKVALNAQSLQILPTKQRIYPFAPPKTSMSMTPRAAPTEELVLTATRVAQWSLESPSDMYELMRHWLSMPLALLSPVTLAVSRAFNTKLQALRALTMEEDLERRVLVGLVVYWCQSLSATLDKAQQKIDPLVEDTTATTVASPFDGMVRVLEHALSRLVSPLTVMARRLGNDEENLASCRAAVSGLCPVYHRVVQYYWRQQQPFVVVSIVDAALATLHLLETPVDDVTVERTVQTLQKKAELAEAQLRRASSDDGADDMETAAPAADHPAVL
eukprot:gene8814-6345_t